MNKGKYGELISQAQLAFASEKYDVAIAKCEEAVKCSPRSVEALVLMGNTHMVQNTYDAAESCFRNTLLIEPNNGELHFNLASSLFCQQRIADAMEQYAKAIQLGCQEDVLQKIYYVVGVINQIDGKNNEALGSYKKSEDLGGTNVDRADILLKKTQIYVEQNDLNKAENCAIQLKLLVPNEFKSYQLLFQLYIGQGKVDAAASVLEEAKTSCEMNAEVVTEIAFNEAMLYCIRAEQNPENKVELYDEVLRILKQLENNKDLRAEDRCEARITSADIYLKLERYDDAHSIAKAVSVETSPELSEYVERANYIIIEYFAHKKEYSGISQYAQKLKESENFFNNHYGYYAEAYAAKQIAGGSPADLSKYSDCYEHAIAYYRNCTASNPGDFLAYLYRAKCYVDIGRFEKAEELSKVLPEDAQKTIQDYINEEKRRWKK